MSCYCTLGSSKELACTFCKNPAAGDDDDSGFICPACRGASPKRKELPEMNEKKQSHASEPGTSEATAATKNRLDVTNIHPGDLVGVNKNLAQVRKLSRKSESMTVNMPSKATAFDCCDRIMTEVPVVECCNPEDEVMCEFSELGVKLYGVNKSLTFGGCLYATAWYQHSGETGTWVGFGHNVKVNGVQEGPLKAHRGQCVCAGIVYTEDGQQIAALVIKTKLPGSGDGRPTWHERAEGFLVDPQNVQVRECALPMFRTLLSVT